MPLMGECQKQKDIHNATSMKMEYDYQYGYMENSHIRKNLT